MGPAIKRRKLAANSAVPEITFDDSARSEYLTGFHKRKVARIKQGQELAVKKGREELLKARANVSLSLLWHDLRSKVENVVMERETHG
jgi:ribosomal RNA-processing protein 17